MDHSRYCGSRISVGEILRLRSGRQASATERPTDLPPMQARTSRLFVFCRRCRGCNGLAKKLSRAVIGGIADLMSRGIVTEDNFADHALILGEMSFFDHVITGVVFVLGKETKLFLRPQDFGAGESAVFVE